MTWLCTKASQTFSGTFSGTLLNTSRSLLRNLLQNPVEPDLALHQTGTLLNLTWLCAKASWNLLRNLLRNPFEPDLALHQSLPDLLWNLLQNLLRNPVSHSFSGSFSGTSLNLTRRLHQCTPELFWAEDDLSLRCWGKIHAYIIYCFCAFCLFLLLSI